MSYIDGPIFLNFFLLVLISQKKYPTSKVNVNLKLIRKARIKVAVHITTNIVKLLSLP